VQKKAIRLRFLIVAVSFSLSSSTSAQTALGGLISISDNYNGKPISVSIDPVRSAGAITSLSYRGVQYVDDFDHGRLIQSAVTLDGLGECLNPTEAGTNADGSNRTTSSKLLRTSISATAVTTTTRAAYWLTPGENYGQPCGPRTPFREAQNRTVLSNYVISRTLSYYGALIPNLIQAKVTFELPESRAKGIFEALTGYLPPEFDTFLGYDLNTGTLKLLPWSRLERITTEPIIVARADGSASLGVVSSMIEEDGPDQSFYAYFYSPGPGPTAKWACVFEKANLAAGSEQVFDCEFAVGSVDEVISALDKVAFKTGHPRHALPIFGFYRRSKHLYTLSYTEGARAGMSFDKTEFHVQATTSAGAQPLYRCYTPVADDHYVSLRQDCEGQRQEGLLGYVQPVPAIGLVPLYRFYKPRSQTHLITVDYAEGALNGYVPEQKLGYVRP
jgi:hypothetical protein